MPTVSPALFSIVMPCYNHAAFLPDAVASLAAQDIPGLEVIIVNDGSTDGSAAVARELARRFQQLDITVLEQENRGAAAARNSGIRLAKGAWIVALDSDDMLAGGFLEAAAGAIGQQPGITALTGAYREFGGRESEWRLTRFDPGRLKERGNILCTSPFRKSLWTAVGGFDPSHPWGGEDWHFWLKALDSGLRFFTLPVAMLYYRIHERGGMLDAFQAHHEESLAMHYCMLPEMYGSGRLEAAHAVLLGMSGETENAVRRVASRHPRLPLPLFWLGLAEEGRGRRREALALYEEALELSRDPPGPAGGQIGRRLARLRE